MSNTLLICDEPNQPCKNYDLLAYWESFNEENGAFSISKMVEQNSIELRTEYLDWLYRFSKFKINGSNIKEKLLIRDDFSYWWMTLLIEKSQWKSKSLFQSLRLMALNMFLHQHEIIKIDIQIRDKNVRKSIQEWCLNNEIKHTLIPIKRIRKPFFIRRIYNTFPQFIHATVFLIKYLVKHFPMRHSDNRIQSEDNDISFISYFFNLDSSYSNRGIFYTRYWTLLHNVLTNSNSSYKVNWLHIFLKNDVTPTAKKAVSLVDRFNADSSSSQTHFLIESEIGWRVLKGVIKDYLRLVYVGLRSKKIKNFFKVTSSSFNLWYVMQDDWNKSLYGSTAIVNCLFLNLFEKNLSVLPKQKKGFYILENQAWERSLIYAWKKAGHGELIGVQHTAVSFWDLRHFFSPLEYKKSNLLNLPIPDKVALNGEAAISQYVKSGFPQNKILHAEALRYIYLDRVKNKSSTKKSFSNKIRLLVIGDYLASLTNKMLQLLKVAIEKQNIDIEIIVKPHPACNIDPLKWPTLNMQITSIPLDQLINSYDVALASNTTAAAIDVYLSEKNVLIMLDSKNFNMSPLREFKGVEYVCNPVELAKKILKKNNVKNFTEIDFFFTESNLPRWRALLEDD